MSMQERYASGELALGGIRELFLILCLFSAKAMKNIIAELNIYKANFNAKNTLLRGITIIYEQREK